LNDLTDEIKAGPLSEENTILGIFKGPVNAPASHKVVQSEISSPPVSELPRSTLVQSSSNVLKEGPTKGASAAAGPKSLQQAPTEMKSRALSGGMEASRWAFSDEGPSKKATTSKVTNPVFPYSRLKQNLTNS
jgi:hypothetical protein